jgi:5-formyltetrahydrofolate cyclo-ligase
MSVEERVAESEAIVEAVVLSAVWQRAERVMLYAPMAEEVDLLGLFGRAGGRELVLPRLSGDGKEMRAHRVERREDVVVGRWRFHEPDPAKCPEVDAGGIDLVLVPGLGFGRDGSRLGRGRGYYDRFLGGDAAGAMRCGVAFGCQVVEAVPVERHDERMGALAVAGGWEGRSGGLDML